MKTFRFKTNINCQGCVDKIRPFMDALPKNTTWEVDTKNKHKILTVRSDKINVEDIIRGLDKVGFSAQLTKKRLSYFF